MTKGLNRILNAVDVITERAGKMSSVIILILMLTIAFEVAARYLFNRPTSWVWPIGRQLFGVYILFGGVYALLRGKHIRIDLIYTFFPQSLKRIAKVITLASIVIFLGVLVWQATWMGWNSFTSGETGSLAFPIPIYPLKMLIPVVAFLFLLQGIVSFFRGRY